MMNQTKQARILAVSGSLRASSINATVLRAFAALVPSNVETVFYQGLGDLPHFNPDFDVDRENAPQSVKDWRGQVQTVDAVVVCSPEYAHGVPGSLKNALDWLVSSGETVGKPFAVINASSRSVHAHAQLIEILTTMAANVIHAASITLPLNLKNMTEAQIIADAQIAALLKESAGNLLQS